MTDTAWMLVAKGTKGRAKGSENRNLHPPRVSLNYYPGMGSAFILNKTAREELGDYVRVSLSGDRTRMRLERSSDDGVSYTVTFTGGGGSFSANKVINEANLQSSDDLPILATRPGQFILDLRKVQR